MRNRGGLALLVLALVSPGCGGRETAAPEPPRAEADASGNDRDGLERLRGHLVWGHEARSFTECGSGREGWAVDGTGGDLLEVHAALTVQPYQPLFVEVLGRWESAPSGGFGADYPEQLVIAELRRAAVEGDGCDEDLAGIEYAARGNEPFWNVEIRATQISFSRLGQAEPLVFPHAVPESAEGAVVYRSKTGGENSRRIEIRISKRRCTDSMSGARFGLAAQVQMDGEVLEGCALVGW